MADLMTDTGTILPVVMGVSGPVVTSPVVLREELTALVAATNPDYTNDLPGSLIEDIASTDVGALTVVDQARVDLINSITPYGANEFLLNQLGQIYGVQRGKGSNTSVYVTFNGTPGFVIPIGFTVSDGNHQYVVQSGGVLGAAGQSPALYCLANVAGSWAVPIHTVTQIVTSVPTGVVLSCTNQSDGLPGATDQTNESYRAQVLQAGLAASQGSPNFIKTALQKVSGVQPHLISVRNVDINQWQVICGGGDPYDVAYAIYSSVPDISSLVGSTLGVTNFTAANPGVVTVDLNHGYSTGQVVTIAGVTPSGYNGSYTITVIDEKSFSVGVNTSGFGAYVSGGVVTPNFRNVTVSINDFPDTYDITFVNPPVQTVDVTLTWNTIGTNYVSPTAVAQAGTPAIVTYINSIYVGQPISIFELQDTFQNAVAGIIPISLISKMDFVIAINGIATSPAIGDIMVYGDPESYFATTEALVTITQG